jgi:exopolyphosphatase/guanosine-5'-triphosphate,3'-diphosphate pyrophosphatase
MDESRLCYTGIASAEGFVDHNRLVIDVGGASTELMIARQNELISFFSLDIGCVSLTNLGFMKEQIEESHFSDAIALVNKVIDPVAKPLKELGWSEVMGCGGTVSSLFTFLHRRRMTATALSASSLERFKTAVLEQQGSSLPLTQLEVGADRARLLPAGATLLMGIFQKLGIEKLKPVFSSVSQGLLVELARSLRNRGDQTGQS